MGRQNRRPASRALRVPCLTPLLSYSRRRIAPDRHTWKHTPQPLHSAGLIDAFSFPSSPRTDSIAGQPMRKQSWQPVHSSSDTVNTSGRAPPRFSTHGRVVMITAGFPH